MIRMSETIAEIVECMRGRGEDTRMDAALWRRYADRIEAAWKRERDELGADARGRRAADGTETIADIIHYMRQEYAMHLRERYWGGRVHETMLSYADRIEAAHKREYGEAWDKACVECHYRRAGNAAVAREALSAPPRNCDRYATWEDAAEAWRRLERTGRVPFADWLFRTADESEEGK